MAEKATTILQEILGSQGLPGAWGGQMLVIFIITIAACEAGIAMVLILMLARKSGKLDSAAWQDLREEASRGMRDDEAHRGGRAP